MFKKIAIIFATLMLVMSCSLHVDSKPSEPKENPSASSTGNGSQLYGPPIYDHYLFTVRKEIPHLLILRDGPIIKTGKNVCDTLQEARPLTEQELHDAILGFSQGSGFMTPDESAFFIGASADAFCPDVADEIQDVISTNS